MGFFGFFREHKRRRILVEQRIGDDAWAHTRDEHPILRGLSRDEDDRLRDLASIFLVEKEFVPVRKLVLRDHMKLSVAVQAVLPLLNLGLDWIDDFSSIYMMPRNYKERKTEMRGAVVHEYMDDLGGEVTELGSLILSWKDVEESGWGSGYNVVIHEIAHKLDASNLALDGCPYLGNETDPVRWKDVFTRAYDDLVSKVGKRPPVDEYAAESPVEFFAVACEEFFERPARLARYYGDVYGELASFFKQDPANRFATAGRAPRKRNA